MLKEAFFSWPGFPVSLNNTLSGGTDVAIDSSGEQSAWIFRVPKTGNISKFRFATHTVGTSETLRVRLQTVDASTGLPTGTAYGGSSTETVAAPATSTIYTVTFGTPASATAGDMVAAVIDFNSTVGNVQFKYSGGAGATLMPIPYHAQRIASWAKVGRAPICSVGYDDGTFPYIGCLPASVTSGALSVTTGTTPDEIGNRFKLAFGARVIGVAASRWPSTTGRDVKYVLYNDAGTELASATSDVDMAAGSLDTRIPIYRFSSPYTLQANTWYRICYQPQTASSVNYWRWVLTDAAELEMFGGSNCYYCDRSDAGAFSDDQTKITEIGMWFDRVDIPGIYSVSE